MVRLAFGSLTIKPEGRMTKSLGATLLAMAALIGLMVLVLRKGPMGGLMVILAIAVLLVVVSALAVLFGKRKKNG
jgi:hypothetical protein